MFFGKCDNSLDTHQLSDMNLANIEANIKKAEATIIVAETLRDVFKNLKKWKEAQTR